MPEVFEAGDRIAWVGDDGTMHKGTVAAQHPARPSDWIVNPDDDHGYYILDPATVEWRIIGDALSESDPFDAVVSEIQALNHRKRSDYASEADIFSNFKDAGRQLGLTAGHAVELHVATKQSRLRQLLGTAREPNNESIRDSLIDRAVYALISVALWDAGLYGRAECR